MANTIYYYALVAVLAPLLGSLIAGLFGKKIGVLSSQLVTIAGIAVSFFCALALSKWILFDHAEPLNQTVYIWGTSGSTTLAVGFLIDQLTVLMMSIVTFVSLLVHIYSIGYMEGDPGVQRFFSYMSLFTFGMLSLVMANNFLLLFFGWETVGLVSYLLIGFWFKKDSAALGGFKAFIVNRVGDFGFLLGIAVIFKLFRYLGLCHGIRHRAQVGGFNLRAYSYYELVGAYSDLFVTLCGVLWVNLHNYPCTFGCQNPWKAQRPFLH